MILTTPAQIRRFLFLSMLVVAALPLSCSSGGDGGPSDGGAGADFVVVQGILLDTNGEPLSGISVKSVVTGSSDTSASDGTFTVDLTRADSRIAVGGEGDASFVVRVDLPAGEFVELSRPLFVEAVANGVSRQVASGVLTADRLVDDPTLPGLSLVISSGTRVSFDASPETVTLLALPHDRWPAPLPDSKFSRFAVHVGPRDLEFSRPTSLSVPNLEGLAPNSSADLFELASSTGAWGRVGSATVSADGAQVTAMIQGGGIFAVVGKGSLPRTRIMGRVLAVSGSEPLQGFRVIAPGSRLAVSDRDGFFTLDDFAFRPGRPIRLLLISPIDLRHEAVTTPPITLDGSVALNDIGNLGVEGRFRATFAPTVSFTPGRGAGGVEEFPRIRVRFERLMDLSTISIKVVRGISRLQDGVEGDVLLRFPGSGTELEFVPRRPLRNGEFYTVFVPKEARDTLGNQVREDQTSSRFTVRDSAPVLSERGLLVHRIEPSVGVAGDEVTIFGENLNPEAVRFGSVAATILAFDDATKEFLVVRVPTGLTGEVSVQVKDLDGNFHGDRPFRPSPLIEALSDARADPIAPQVFGLGVHLGASPAVVWNGVRGGAIAPIDPTLCPLDELARRACFEIDLPTGVSAGNLYLEVDGIRTRGFFVAIAEPFDDARPEIVEVSLSAGETVSVDAPISVLFSEAISGSSRISVRNGASAIGGLQIEVSHDADGRGLVTARAPEAGWPTGAVLRLIVDRRVSDLAGNEFDANGSTADPDSFSREFAAAN